MADKTLNHKLRALMEEADLSAKSLARRVRDAAASHADPISCDHTYIGRWLNGMVPRGNTAAYLAEALGTKLGRVVSLADIGMDAAGESLTSLGLIYAQTISEAVRSVSGVWRADLDELGPVLTGSAHSGAWNEVALTWLVSDKTPVGEQTSRGPRVGRTDVERLRSTMDMFAQLDNRFGGGHARRALIQYLDGEAAQMLGGSFSEEVGRSLFSTVAEATLLAAWMSYDTGRHSLAQRYFIQALRLAEAGGDRQLAGSILGAMSHQATFVGRFGEAANLARAAATGAGAQSSATLRAMFGAMEARALARLGDAPAVDQVLGEAERTFDQRRTEDDPEWIEYFNEQELAAEFGHSMRDLGRAAEASSYAMLSLQSVDGDETYLRSDFFVTMVLADSQLAQGDIDQACVSALSALRIGDQLKSARPASYVREFYEHLAETRTTSTVRDFLEEARSSQLWLTATEGADS